MPVVDKVAQEYSDRVTFLAVAWKGTAADTAERAAELLPSGAVLWALDEEEAVFGAFGIPYQPATILITGDDVIVDGWAGAREESEMRAAIERLLSA